VNRWLDERLERAACYCDQHPAKVGGWAISAIVLLFVLVSISYPKHSDVSSSNANNFVDHHKPNARSTHCQALKEEMEAINLLRDWTDQKMAPLVADYDWDYSFKCDQETGAWAIRRGFTLMNGSMRYTTVCSSDPYCDMRPGQR